MIPAAAESIARTYIKAIVKVVCSIIPPSHSLVFITVECYLKYIQNKRQEMLLNFNVFIIVLLSIFAMAANGFVHRGSLGGGRRGGGGFPGGTPPFNPKPPRNPFGYPA